MKKRHYLVILWSVILVSILLMVVFAIFHLLKKTVPFDIVLTQRLDVISSAYLGGAMVVERQGETVLFDINMQEELSLGAIYGVKTFGGILHGLNAKGNLLCFNANGNSIDSKIDFQPYLQVNLDYTDELIPQENAEGVLGYVNQQGVWIISPQYSKGQPYANFESCLFSEGYAIVEAQSSSQDILLNQYGAAEPLCLQGGVPSGSQFRNGLYRYKTIDLHGDSIKFVTTKNTVLPTTSVFIDAYDFSCGLAAVQIQNGTWGYIDTSGALIIAPEFSAVSSFDKDRATVSTADGKVMIINRFGDILETLPPLQGYTFLGGADSYFEDMIAVQTISVESVANANAQYALVDVATKKIVKFGLTPPVWINGYWSSFYANGCTIYLPKCKRLVYGDGNCRIYQNVLVIEQNNQDTLISTVTGRILLRTKQIRPFSEGLAVASTLWGDGYIDTAGNWVIPAQFSRANDFRNGMAYAERNHEAGLIANPLIYGDGWSSNEVHCAAALGISSSAEKSEITYTEFSQILNGWFSAQKKLATSGIAAPLPAENFDAFLAQIVLEDSDTVIDRQHVALYLSRAADALGLTTASYINFYSDADEVSPQCQNEFAFISSLNVFESVNNRLLPTATLSSREACIVVLRFFRATQFYLA